MSVIMTDSDLFKLLKMVILCYDDYNHFPGVPAGFDSCGSNSLDTSKIVKESVSFYICQRSKIVEKIE